MAAGLTARVAPYLVVGAAGCYLYYVAAHFEFHARAGTLGPDAWPKGILALLILTCVIKFASLLFTRGDREISAGVIDELAGADLGATAPVERHPVLLVAGMVITVLYVALVQKLGFFTATVPYIALFVVLGGYRRWGIVAAISVIGTLLLLFFFMRVVYVSLPIGVEPFSAVTLFLMQVLGIR